MIRLHPLDCEMEQCSAGPINDMWGHVRFWRQLVYWTMAMAMAAGLRWSSFMKFNSTHKQEHRNQASRLCLGTRSGDDIRAVATVVFTLINHLANPFFSSVSKICTINYIQNRKVVEIIASAVYWSNMKSQIIPTILFRIYFASLIFKVAIVPLAPGSCNSYAVVT